MAAMDGGDSGHINGNTANVMDTFRHNSRFQSPVVVFEPVLVTVVVPLLLPLLLLSLPW
jgi:hypothetical protein